MDFKNKTGMGFTINHDSNNGLYGVQTSQRINVKLAALLNGEAYNRGNAWYYRIGITYSNADRVAEGVINIRTMIRELNTRIKKDILTSDERNKIATAEALVGLCQFGHTVKAWNIAERYHVELRNKFNMTLHCN